MAGERELARQYLERARAELGLVERRGFWVAGHAFAPVLLVKGELNAAELAGGALLAGPDGAALRAALARLGYPDDGWAACSSVVGCASGLGGAGAADPADPAALAEAVEAFDPELVVALDAAAAAALAGAWGLDVPLVPGEVARVRGRRVLALGGFEAALADARAKQVAWARLKQVPPLPAPL